MGALALLISGCLAKSVSASLTCSSLPREWEGAKVLIHSRALSGFLGAKPPLEGFSWSWLKHKGFSELLGFCCTWLVPILFQLGFVPLLCSEPVFSLLSISASIPLPFWHCPPSSPRDFSGHSRPCSHCRCEWWGWYSSGQQPL